MGELSPSFAELKAEVDDRLGRFLRDRAASIPEARPLIAEIRRLIDAGGKRLRPVFCYWGYRAAGDAADVDIVQAAASLELLHTFALVHDDIMDASEERRGVETVHARHGINVAILVGDLALVLADAMFMTARAPVERLLRAFEGYSRMREEVIAGQLLDLRSDARTLSESEARRIAVLKSGRYSVQEPLVIGALLAGARPETVARLSALGRPLGEAFQLRDDLLGTFGDRATTGKPTDIDMREGKHHVLFAKALQVLDGDDRRWLVDHWGRGAELDDDDIAYARSLLVGCGARSATERLLDELVCDARARLRECEIGDEAGDALDRLIDLAVIRTS